MHIICESHRPVPSGSERIVYIQGTYQTCIGSRQLRNAGQLIGFDGISTACRNKALKGAGRGLPNEEAMRLIKNVGVNE